VSSNDLTVTIKRSTLTRGQERLLTTKTKNVLFAGGFGSGKTVGLGLKLLQLKTANPGVPGLLLAQSWRALWSITYRRLMGVVKRSLPREWHPRLIDRQGECYLDFGDGVPIFLRSAHDDATFDGLDVGWALGDEARHWPKKSHDTLLGRVRVKCKLPQICYASTPALNWLADEFNSNKEGRELIRAPTSENARNLSPDYVQNLLLSYSPRLVRAVVHGEFVVLEGAVYEQVDTTSSSSPWILDYDPKLFPERRTILAVDPGFRRSAWLLFHEIDPTTWICFHELMPDDTSDDACVQRVNDCGFPVDEIWCDPAADQTQSTLSLDTLQMLKGIELRTRGGIRYITGAFRSIAYGVDKTRTLLGDPANGLPIRICFARRLLQIERGLSRGVLRDLAAYRYPETKDDRAVRDEPLKDGKTDHSMDALRHFAIGMWLTSPLRKIDPKLREMELRGYKRAA
jgi:hypothetical protein